MGREKNILLGLLGLLAGVFVGALSLKLLVPRPPAGTGPDIRSEVASTTQELVEPPAPSPGGWDFAAAPPLVPEPPVAAANPPAAEPPSFAAAPPDDARAAPSRFAAPASPPPAAEPAVPRDVTPAAWDRPEPAALRPVGAAEPIDRNPTAGTFPPTRDPFVAPVAAMDLPIAGAYVVQSGDSWWDVAERAYGDGRLYRALFAWNRARDPAVSLAPGTRLDVPPLDRLAAAWPRLLPRADHR